MVSYEMFINRLATLNATIWVLHCGVDVAVFEAFEKINFYSLTFSPSARHGTNFEQKRYRKASLGESIQCLMVMGHALNVKMVYDLILKMYHLDLIYIIFQISHFFDSKFDDFYILLLL